MLQKIDLKRTKWLLVPTVVLVLNSAYLFVADRMPGPQRAEFAAFFYLLSVMLHLALGLVLLVPLLLVSRALGGALREARRGEMVCGTLLRVALAVCFAT